MFLKNIISRAATVHQCIHDLPHFSRDTNMDISMSYYTHVMMKDVTKISIWWVKGQQVGGESKS